MNGFLNMNKPSGWTSHDVVAKIRALLNIQKVGHTGTLDPDATGVLPICIGKATKIAQFLLEKDKEYQVRMRLGEQTDTQDASGKIIGRQSSRHLSPEEIHKVIRQFEGPCRQLVPMYSAVKVGGQPLYRAARQNRPVDRPSRDIILYGLSDIVVQPSDGEECVDVSFVVSCSKGTYIRTLCADIGERLGVGGHLAKLIRTRSGPFRVEESMALEELKQVVSSGIIAEKVIPIQEVLSDYPGIWVNPEASNRVIHGGWISGKEVLRFQKEFKTGEVVLVYNSASCLVALALAEMSCDQLATADQTAPALRVNRVLV